MHDLSFGSWDASRPLLSSLGPDHLEPSGPEGRSRYSTNPNLYFDSEGGRKNGYRVRQRTRSTDFHVRPGVETRFVVLPPFPSIRLRYGSPQRKAYKGSVTEGRKDESRNRVLSPVDRCGSPFPPTLDTRSKVLRVESQSSRPSVTCLYPVPWSLERRHTGRWSTRTGTTVVSHGLGGCRHRGCGDDFLMGGIEIKPKSPNPQSPEGKGPWREPTPLKCLFSIGSGGLDTTGFTIGDE